MTNFKQLRIWLKGMEIAKDCYRFVESFPRNEKLALAQQVNRSAVSIPSNIAEGSGRSSPKEYARFIEIAFGSSFELETQILIAESIGMGNTELKNLILKDINEEQKMLRSFIVKLKAKPISPAPSRS